MSFTSTVPAAVPSDFHSSEPVPGPGAANHMAPPATNGAGLAERVVVLMSARRVVPADVPSLTHGSTFGTQGSPFAGAASAAENSRRLPKGVSAAARQAVGVVCTCPVPAAVPSVL